VTLSLDKLTRRFDFEINSGLLDTSREEDLACYYKLPLFLLKTGQTDLAKQTLDFIYQKFLMQDGDFKTKAALKSVKPEYVEYWSYFNGWILRAANLLKHDVPSPALEYFQSLHLGQGKFLSHAPVAGGNRDTDVLTVAHHGLFYLESGQNEWSGQAAEFLRRACDKQTEISTYFALRFNGSNKPITEHLEDQQMFFSVKKNQGENQLYFMLAYPCAFLGLHYKKTANPASLDYARRYMDFILSCGDEIYTSRFSHKTAWAASILYAETSEEKYFTVVRRIVDHFIQIQSKDGLWFQEEGASVYLDQSAEIGCWFSQILKNVRLAQLKKSESIRFLSPQISAPSDESCQQHDRLEDGFVKSRL
jgi:hypothetical protein